MSLSAPTVQDTLDFSNVTNIADALKLVEIGTIIAGLVPRWVIKTGLTSSATQEHKDDVGPQPFRVHAVTLSDDTPLSIVNAGAGAGKVVVSYDTDGVPTFVFSAAVTGYKVLGCPHTKELGAILTGTLAG